MTIECFTFIKRFVFYEIYKETVESEEQLCPLTDTRRIRSTIIIVDN
jgi:hypothetical protein